MRPGYVSSCACSFVLLVAVASSLAMAVPAQCANPWLASPGPPGVLGATRQVNAATLWDRDGAGPLPALTVIGGDFTIAGSVNATRIAAFDPATNAWSPLGLGLDGAVRALQVLPNGDLVAAGVFSTAGGVAAVNIARFDGTSWSPLGTGIPGSVDALALLPNGDLVAGGFFSTAGGVPANNIARWNGTTWAPLGAGVISASGAGVRSLALLPNGDLVAGGLFTTAGGVAANNIARWDGVTWAPLALGLDNSVMALLLRSNGELVAGGHFNYSGSSATSPWLNHVARWNGTAWSQVGAGVAGSASALIELANGNLVIGCQSSQDSILQWNGVSWSTMDAPTDDAGKVLALTTLSNGDLVAGGYFLRLGGVGAGSVARWNGTYWSGMPPGLSGPVSQLVALADDSVVASGAFAVGSSIGIARWNGSAWLPLGPSLEGISRIRLLDNGNILAAGSFPAGGGVIDNLAQWNGTSWTTYAPGLTGPNGQVTDVVVLPNGNVVASVYFLAQPLALWNGVSWSTLGPLSDGPGLVPTVTAMTVCGNGDLVIAGRFTAVGGVAASNIARWNGSVWSPLGSGLQLPLGNGYVSALRELPNGDVVVSGILLAGGVGVIARWNGASWLPLGSGLNNVANALEVLPNGDLVAGGNFTMAGGAPASFIARWNGASWSAFGAGTDNAVSALAVRANGDLVVGGWFHAANGSLSPFFAAITTTCPATAVVSGSGCTGSGGPNVLTATTLPWLGSTFRARATGLPPSSFALIASGVTPIALPLTVLFPQSLPGCSAWVFADLIELALPVAGAVTTQIVVPNSASLVSFSFHQQVLPFVFDPSGNLIELTSTNALTMTLGAF